MPKLNTYAYQDTAHERRECRGCQPHRKVMRQSQQMDSQHQQACTRANVHRRPSDRVVVEFWTLTSALRDILPSDSSSGGMYGMVPA